MTKIVINANDTPEEIERKIKEGFSHIPLIIEAWNKHFGPSSKEENLEEEDKKEGDML